MSVEANKRVVKNTIFLYIRTFVSMLISLYTSRKILEALGVSDFGIYNVVGGVIAMLTFLNGSMSVATQRFLTVELGSLAIMLPFTILNISSKCFMFLGSISYEVYLVQGIIFHLLEKKDIDNNVYFAFISVVFIIFLAYIVKYLLNYIDVKLYVS